MSKVIRLTESDLHNMIKEAINELDWRTYASAAEKDKRGRANNFKDAAKDSFYKKYNSGLDTNKHELVPGYDLEHIDYHGPSNSGEKTNTAYYYYPSDNFFDEISDREFDVDTIRHAKPRQQFRNAARDLKSFQDGKAHYNKDTHAWENDED